MTDRAAIREALGQAILAYGGVDHVVVTAGLYPNPDTDGRIPDAMWDTTFRVNVTGPFLVADEAARVWEVQDLPGSLVITTSVNAVVPKAGSFAYDTVEGRREPPGPRTGGRAGAARARQRRRPGDGRRGQPRCSPATA